MSLKSVAARRRGSARDLTDVQIKAALALAAAGKQAMRDTVLLRLSLTLALRVSDCAGLQWRDCLDGSGAVSDCLIIRPETAKYGAGTKLPIPSQVKLALQNLLEQEIQRYGEPASNQALFRSQRGFMQRQSMVDWFKRIYASAGAKGASSHSGRRHAITKMARNISIAGGSLADIQAIARHRSIQTTQRYIALSGDAQINVINMVDRLVR